MSRRATVSPHPVARDAREAAVSLAARHRAVRDSEGALGQRAEARPPACAEGVSQAAPKARTGRRPDPNVAKAAAKIQAQMEAGGTRCWQPVYREHIPDYGTLAPEQRRTKQRLLRARVRAYLSRRRKRGAPAQAPIR